MLPYTRVGSGGVPSFAWRARVGRVPANRVNWMIRGTPEERLWLNGYIDYNANSKTEGHFKCPSVWDQVRPKSKGSWECQFTPNGELMKMFYQSHIAPDPPDSNAYCKRLTDVKAPIVLIGDCSLWPGGGWYPGPRFTTSQQKLLTGDGPWSYIMYLRGNPVDFYGHTGETSNLAFTDAHVEGIRELLIADFLLD